MFHRFRCDLGHEWVVHSTDAATHSGTVKLCPEGHGAVVDKLEKPVREYYYSVLPAERLVASVQGDKVICRDMYYILASHMNGQSCYITHEPFTLVVACDMLRQLLSSLSFDPSRSQDFSNND